VEEFLKKYQQRPVVEYPNDVSSNPLVSVSVMTYQHVNYIQQCLDGILMQKTNFPVEILVGEDGSTDGTRELCVDYAKKYPDRIRLFLHHRENNIKINGIPTGRFNYLYNLFSSRGKYVAFCEGDDYWTHPGKLQRQVDFLENNPDYGMVSTDVELIDQAGQQLEENPMVSQQRKNRKPEVSFYDLLNVNHVNTCTTCIRKHLIKSLADRVIRESLGFVFDYWYWLNISLASKIGIFYEKTSAYRVHEGGLSRQQNFLSFNRPLVQYDVMRKYLNVVDRQEFKSHSDVILKGILSLIRNQRISFFLKIKLMALLFQKFRLLPEMLHAFAKMARKCCLRMPEKLS